MSWWEAVAVITASVALARIQTAQYVAMKLGGDYLNFVEFVRRQNEEARKLDARISGQDSATSRTD